MQQLAYMQMLRAGAFAATAFDAVARLSVAFCVGLIIVVLTVMAVMYLHCIQAGEEVRSADVLRTSVDAVADGSFRSAQLFFQRKRDAYIPVSEQRAQSLLVGVLYLSEACQAVHVFSVIQAYCISVVQY